MAYGCIKYRGAECIGCGECHPEEPEEVYDGYCDNCGEPLTNEDVIEHDHICPACGAEL